MCQVRCLYTVIYIVVVLPYLAEAPLPGLKRKSLPRHRMYKYHVDNSTSCTGSDDTVDQLSQWLGSTAATIKDCRGVTCSLTTTRRDNSSAHKTYPWPTSKDYVGRSQSPQLLLLFSPPSRNKKKPKKLHQSCQYHPNYSTTRGRPASGRNSLGEGHAGGIVSSSTPGRIPRTRHDSQCGDVGARSDLDLLSRPGPWTFAQIGPHPAEAVS